MAPKGIRHFTITVLLSALVIFPLFANAGEPVLPEEPLKGRRLFFQKGCIICHSIRGEGGKAGPDLSIEGKGRTVTQLSGAMLNHYPLMRDKMKQMGVPFPRFSPGEMAELIAYIYFVGYFDDPTSANVPNGKVLFKNKGCSNCHMINGEGGEIGPDLAEWKRFASPIMWAQLMWNHSPAIGGKMNEMSISRSKFELDEMADLIAYVYSASVPKEYDVVYSPSGNPSRGRGLIVEYECIRCHSIYEESGKIGPPLSARNHDRSVSQLAGTMWNHSTDIILRTLVQEKINIRRLTSAGMADIAAYLFFVGYFSPPGDGKKGEEVFVDKGCSRCHTVRGVGGALGPDLSKYGGPDTYFQPVLFAQSMWNHAPMMAEAMKKLMVTWPRFEKQEMDDLLAYLRRSDDNH